MLKLKGEYILFVLIPFELDQMATTNWILKCLFNKHNETKEA